MEFYCSKDSTVAAKVFEVGMRTLDLQEDSDAAEYVEIYLDFLITMNDDNSRIFYILNSHFPSFYRHSCTL